jgi:hypothetical protein
VDEGPKNGNDIPVGGKVEAREVGEAGKGRREVGGDMVGVV